MSTCAEASVLSDVRQSVAKLTEVELRHMSDASLLEFTKLLRPIVCQLQSVELRLIAAIDQRRAAVSAGSRSTAVWLRNDLRVAGAVTKVKTARALVDLPQMTAALIAGQVSPEHVSIAARICTEVGDGAVAADLDERLVHEACQLAPARFARVAAAMSKAFNSAETDSARATRHGPRWLLARHTADGGVAIRGRFDGPAGARLLTALDALAPSSGSVEQPFLPVQRAEALIRLCAAADGELSVEPGESERTRGRDGSRGRDVPRSAASHGRQHRVKQLTEQGSGRQRRRRRTRR